MARCTKSDRRDGSGCVKPAGHLARCRVRPDAARAFRAGGAAAPAPAARGRRKAGGLAGALGELAGTIRRIAEEVDGLVAEVGPALDAAERSVHETRAKATATLKALIASRRQVARLTKGAAKGDES